MDSASALFASACAFAATARSWVSTPPVCISCHWKYEMTAAIIATINMQTVQAAIIQSVSLASSRDLRKRTAALVQRILRFIE